MDNNYKITIKGESHPIKTGDTFHRLTITEFTRHNGKLSANCICTCGNHVENVLVRHLPRSTLSNRLNTAKWSIEKAFTTPVPSTQTDTGHK